MGNNHIIKYNNNDIYEVSTNKNRDKPKIIKNKVKDYINIQMAIFMKLYFYIRDFG